MEHPTHAIIDQDGNIDQIVYPEDYPEDIDMVEIPAEYWLKPMRWDAGSRAFVEDVDLARSMKWEAVKARRELAELGGCQTAYGRVDTTDISKLKINGAVTMAQIAVGQSQPFSISWTMADNTDVALDGAQMIEVGLAVGQHVSACHDVARQLREQIMAEDISIADIEAIDIESAGWPL